MTGGNYMSDQKRPQRVEEPKFDPYTGERLDESSITTTKLTGNMSDSQPLPKKPKMGYSFEINLSPRQFTIVCLVIFALTYLTSLAITLTTIGLIITFVIWTIVVYGLMAIGTFAGRRRVYEIPDEDDKVIDHEE